MMMTVDRWQRVPMVGGFRGNGAPSPDWLLSVLFLRHYSPVRSPFFAPFVHHFLPRPVVRLLWTFVKKLFFRFKSGAHWPVASFLAILFFRWSPIVFQPFDPLYSAIVSSIYHHFKLLDLSKKHFVWKLVPIYAKKSTKRGIKQKLEATSRRPSNVQCPRWGNMIQGGKFANHVENYPFPAIHPRSKIFQKRQFRTASALQMRLEPVQK